MDVAISDIDRKYTWRVDGGLSYRFSYRIIDHHRLAISLKEALSSSLGFRLFGIFDDTHLNHLSVVSLFLPLGGLDSSGFLLLLELGFTDLLLLHLVDSFDEHRLVLVKITLGSNVEVMIDILGDFLALSVLLEKSSKDSLTSHPEDLDRHTGVLFTLSLTKAGVSTLPFGLMHLLDARSGVHMNLSLHDKTITVELPDVLSGVSKGNLVALIGI